LKQLENLAKVELPTPGLCDSVTTSAGKVHIRGRRIIMADAGVARSNGLQSGTLTRADLSDIVHNRLGVSRAESAGMVERVLHHMCHALSVGQNVKISGFGTFILRDKGERVGRNPKTGVEVPIAPRRVMTFRASQIMRDRIAK
jgi:integration host factor subunit alpha